jgi:hypothetical protein
MGISKVEFILYYSIFLFTVIQLTAMAGSNVIINAPTPPTIPPEPTAWDLAIYPIANIGYFFTLMIVNSTFTLFGIMILTPFTIAMIWAVLELLRGV